MNHHKMTMNHHEPTQKHHKLLQIIINITANYLKYKIRCSHSLAINITPALGQGCSWDIGMAIHGTHPYPCLCTQLWIHTQTHVGLVYTPPMAPTLTMHPPLHPPIGPHPYPWCVTHPWHPPLPMSLHPLIGSHLYPSSVPYP